MTQSAFEDIYRTHFDRVFRYLLCLCRNRQLAEEITSETFFKALNAIDRFAGNCSMESWLCQIAKNTYFSYLKKNRQCADIASLPDLADDSISPEEQCCEQDATLRICRAMCDIDEPYHSVFYLRIFEERSFRQIAQAYGKTENWACVTYHRAKQKIRKIMGEQS